jgi:hypothetical protein
MMWVSVMLVISEGDTQQDADNKDRLKLIINVYITCVVNKSYMCNVNIQ